jgi:hypothetical protein
MSYAANRTFLLGGFSARFGGYGYGYGHGGVGISPAERKE